MKEQSENGGDRLTLFFLILWLFLVLKHSGLHPITAEVPDHDLAVILRVLHKLAFYESEERHGIKSRKWDNHEGFSAKIECCIPLKVRRRYIYIYIYI
jgi:hypothetical protein